MGKTLYLMRHGETLFNLTNRTQGWCDSPLTERGQEQARNAARVMREKGFEFDHFYCSTQERASDTLELVMRELYGELRPYERLKGIKESFYGQYEAAPLPILIREFERDRDAFVWCGGEPYEQMQDRMESTLTEVMSRPGHENVLAVAHMRCSLSFVERVVGEDVVGNELTNCAILRFDWDPEKGFTFRDITQTGGTGIMTLEEALGE